jgi:hypothetical protein
MLGAANIAITAAANIATETTTRLLAVISSSLDYPCNLYSLVPGEKLCLCVRAAIVGLSVLVLKSKPSGLKA